ncbi:MAG TPA: hypothetical protein VM677_19675 [Actinokineospora sp.]|nr:hypothetical protein [Actinokineospora sp.]
MALVLNSAGGKVPGRARSRNSDYVPALDTLLARLALRSAVIEAAIVDSAKVQHLPRSERSLIDGPVALSLGLDLAALRKVLTTGQGPIGKTDDGNNRKKIRLVLDVPGYGIGDAKRLADDLSSPVFSSDWLLDAVGTMKLHQSGGKPSLHKPLSILWALGRSGDRLIPWPEFRDAVGPLLGEFNENATPQYPFWHLTGSPDLWEAHGVSGPPTAADVDATAGFTAHAAALLENPMIREMVVQRVLSQYFGPGDHRALRDRVGIAGPVATIDVANGLGAMGGDKLVTLPAGTLDQMCAAVRRVEQAELRAIIVGDKKTEKCALCGHEFPLRYLVAAHIKPRSQCTDEERRDLPNVAMAACSFGCDLLFETGHVAVGADGLIMAGAADPSGRFAELVAKLDGTKCTAHRDETEPYFAWHREHRFN